MKYRVTIFKTLEEKSSEDLFVLIQELKEEIYDFYFKLDLFYHYQLNCNLFHSIYLSQTYMTLLELSFDLSIDTKTIQKFIEKTEDFVQAMIVNKKKYKPLSRLL